LFQNPADVVTDGKRFSASLAGRFPRHELQELVKLEKRISFLNIYRNIFPSWQIFRAIEPSIYVDQKLSGSENQSFYIWL
jgi:hypothetical protein